MNHLDLNMRLVFLGDVHGLLDKALEMLIPLCPDAVIQVGDLGVWPNSKNIDSASKRHQGAGDFSEYYTGNKILPVPIYFTHGNHEDQQWLQQRNMTWLIPNLFYISVGVIELAGIKIAFIGGNHGLPKKIKHIQPDGVNKLLNLEFNILVSHECCYGQPVKVGRPQKDLPGSHLLTELVKIKKPVFHFCGHYHQYLDICTDDTHSIVLNSVPHQNCYYIMDVPDKIQ